MCRDLSGRRLADIKEEEKLRKWIEKAGEREEEKRRQRHFFFKQLTSHCFFFTVLLFSGRRCLVRVAFSDVLSGKRNMKN